MEVIEKKITKDSSTNESIDAPSSKELPMTLDDIDPKIEAKLRRKFDGRVLTMATLLYLFSFLTRANIGNAKVLGLQDDLNLAENNRMSICMTAFYITYIFFEIPINIVTKKIGPRLSLTLMCFFCGLLTMCNAFVNSFGSLFVVRLLIGLVQSGVVPGISYALGSFYRRHELLTRVGIYCSCASLAGAFGGLLAVGFSYIPPWGVIHTWKNIFFFEGIMMMVAAGVIYYVLPDSPGASTFLTEEERNIATLRIQLESLSSGKKEPVTMAHFKAAMFNFNTWVMGIGLFCALLAMNSIALFMPSLLSDFGWDTLITQVMTVPPYVFGCVYCIILSILSDKLRSRGLFLYAVCAPFITIGFAVLVGVEAMGPRYMAIFFATAGSFTCSPFFVGWSVDNTAGPAVRAIANAFVISLGNAGGLVASWAYRPSQAPDYLSGNVANLVMGVMVCITAASCTFYMKWENKQRAAGNRDHILEGLSQEEINQLGHRHPQFRFTA